MGVFDVTRCNEIAGTADARKGVLVEVLKGLEKSKPTFRGNPAELRINTHTLRQMIEEDGPICENVVRRWSGYLKSVKAEA